MLKEKDSMERGLLHEQQPLLNGSKPYSRERRAPTRPSYGKSEMFIGENSRNP
jgi:hypothetical protein